MVESLMFPIDTGFHSQPDHSLWDGLLRLWTLICLFKPHKFDKFYLKEWRFSPSSKRGVCFHWQLWLDPHVSAQN